MRTSRIKALNKGFTLIELSVVITLLVLFAAAVMPNLVNLRRSRDLQTFYSSARDIAVLGRETAISKSEQVELTYDDSQRRLVLSSVDTTTGDKQEIRHVDLPEGVTTGAFKLGGEDSNSSDWILGFYADGKSDGGGVELTVDGASRSLIVDSSGFVTMPKGELPDTSDETWEAGSYEQRA